MKECYEAEYWLEILYRVDALSPEQFKSLSAKCGTIRRKLIASITTAKGNKYGTARFAGGSRALCGRISHSRREYIAWSPYIACLPSQAYIASRSDKLRLHYVPGIRFSRSSVLATLV